MNHKRKQTPYPDTGVNSYAASELQHMPGARMPDNAVTNSLPARADSFLAQQEHPYIPLKAEGQRQWDRDAPPGSNQMMSHLYPEGPRGNDTQSFYHGQMPDPKVDSGIQVSKETRAQSHEQDMEIGYEDKPSPLTFEGMEQKFQGEILKLAKEQSDAEDAENARHREKILEINTLYQEKLSSLRAQQANRREDFLRKESQARLYQYQQAGMGQQPIPSGPRGYHGPPMADLPQAYVTGQLEPYREPSPFLGGGRRQGPEGRVPKGPEGRVPYPQGPEGRAPYPQGPEGRAPYPQGPEGRIPYPHGRVYNNTSGGGNY